MFLGPAAPTGSAHPTDPAGWNNVAGFCNEIERFAGFSNVSGSRSSHELGPSNRSCWWNDVAGLCNKIKRFDGVFECFWVLQLS
jgi:hypothetical protein